MKMANAGLTSFSFDRDDQAFDFIEHNYDIPSYLKHNPIKFDFMLDRTPPNANFRDLSRT
jgi:beta-1,4-mannosyl-glycoprotein beta-1,4-N-acetylglucosaminyltransferase